MLHFFFSFTLSLYVPHKVLLEETWQLTLNLRWPMKMDSNSSTKTAALHLGMDNHVRSNKAFVRWFSHPCPSSDKGKLPSFLNYILSRNCGSPNSLNSVCHRCSPPHVTHSKDAGRHHMTVSYPGSSPSVRFYCGPLDHPSSGGLQLLLLLYHPFSKQLSVASHTNML